MSLTIAHHGFIEKQYVPGLDRPWEWRDPAPNSDRVFLGLNIDRIGDNISKDFTGDRFTSIYPRSGHMVALENTEEEDVRYFTVDGVVGQVYVDFVNFATVLLGNDYDDDIKYFSTKYIPGCDSATARSAEFLSRLLLKEPILDTGYLTDGHLNSTYDLEKDGFIPPYGHAVPRRVYHYGTISNIKVSLYELILFSRTEPAVQCAAVIWLR